MADGDEQAAQLESALTHEQQRLEKLWDAYEQQDQGYRNIDEKPECAGATEPFSAAIQAWS